MNSNAEKAFKELEKLGCPVKEWYDDSRGHFWIDGEECGAEVWLDYWGGLMCGSDKLNEVLDKYDLFFEWENSVVACVYDA